MSTIANTAFKITNTKLYVPTVTLSSKDNVKLVKLLEEEFKRSVYQNEYQTKIKAKDLDDNSFTRFPFDATFQRVKRLFVFLLIILREMLIKLKKKVTQNVFFQE